MTPYVPRVTRSTRAESSIDDYFSDACWIWRRDKNERTVFDLWLHVVDHCTRLVEAVRKERPKEVIDDLADTFMWFLSFIAQTHQSENDLDAPFRFEALPSDLIWNKYPARCSACFDYFITQILGANTSEEAERFIVEKDATIRQRIVALAGDATEACVCECLSRIVFAEERHNKYKAINRRLDALRLVYANATRDRKIAGIRDLEVMFERIFGNAYEVFPIQSIAFHLLEEVGEVTQSLKDCYTYDSSREPFSEGLRGHRLLKFEEELADVFSWIYALLLKIRHVYYRDAQEYFKTLLPRNQPVTVNLDFIGVIHLDDIIWAKYGTDREGFPRNTMYCTGCFTAPCSCTRDLRIVWSKVQDVSKGNN
jgi:NTP pyrophosphatase (non-canonical NTP hydrolase)